jgi:hypothetical protein
MSKATQTDDTVLDNEPLPAPDDDIDTAAPASKAKTKEAAGDDEPELTKPQLKGDPKRDEIARRYREIQAEGLAAEQNDPPDEGDLDNLDPEGRAKPGLSDSEEPGAPAAPADDPELELLVFGKRLKRKRSELIEAYDLEGIDDDRIIKVAQKEMAADQRLAEAREAADQRLRNAGVPEAPAPPPDKPDGPDADGLPPDRSPPPTRPGRTGGEARGSRGADVGRYS